eukprot:4583724-Amphidinium_carterae.1
MKEPREGYWAKSTDHSFTILGGDCLRVTVAEHGCIVISRERVLRHAIVFAQQAGLGKQKHVHTRWVWIQEQVEQGRIGPDRRSSSCHPRERGRPAKPSAVRLVRKHWVSLGFGYRTVWSKLHR